MNRFINNLKHVFSLYWVAFLLCALFFVDTVNAQSGVFSWDFTDSVNSGSVVSPVSSDMSLQLLQQIFGPLPGFSPNAQPNLITFVIYFLFVLH